MNDTDEGIVYEEFEVVEIKREKDAIVMQEAVRKVIAEVSLKMIVNGQELVSVLCLNRHQEELALGFLYNEGVIDSYEDIESIEYNEKMMAVLIKLREGVVIDRRESLRSITSGCGKCYTYINPLKKTRYTVSMNESSFSAEDILANMDKFAVKSEIYHSIGGVHSVFFHTDRFEVLNEDIGRHNCLDKITGILMKANKMELAANGVVFISGRLTSEMLMKMIRLGAPVVVSKSTPTTATIRLAREYNITLLGYVKGGKGTVYACPERLSDISGRKS